MLRSVCPRHIISTITAFILCSRTGVKMRLWMVLSVGAFITTAACGGGVSAPVPLSPILATQQVYYDDGGGYPEFDRLVVRDLARWEDVWARATSGRPSPPARPAVNFERDMLIVAAAGRMNPGDRIQIDSVGVRGELYIVIVSTIVECEPLPADVFPVTIVRVARDDRAVVFSEKRGRAAHCT